MTANVKGNGNAARSLKINIVGIVGSMVAGMLYFFLVTYGGVGNSTHVWAFTYPLKTLFLLGKRLGTGLSFSLLVMCCVGFASAPKFDFKAVVHRRTLRYF